MWGLQKNFNIAQVRCPTTFIIKGQFFNDFTIPHSPLDLTGMGLRYITFKF